MSNGRKKSKKPRQGKTSRPARGRVVHIGPRPKMPLIIAGVFVAGVLLMILASLFSPKKTPASTAAESTNAPATNAPVVAPAVTNTPPVTNAPTQ